ncbi:hypothetical protein BOX15_Mlig030822g4 [Macrostomum lignano]|uniref:DAGKc domain-containing protein n=1 Tax=Macrostomum lignano TaxID=282301 RepID=A0A267G941_9PLAT|nr:hypothetical protein BOX15_Mlig030822g4 [Macrostomum lignano]
MASVDSSSGDGNNGLAKLSLSTAGFSYAGSELIRWSDTIGCHCERSRSVCSLTVFAYPRHRRSGKRERRVIRWQIGGFQDAKECQLHLLAALKSVGNSAGAPPVEPDGACPSVTWPKPCLILLNPRSGSGKAYDLFLRHVNPILADADFPYQLVVTRSLDHVRELSTSVPIDSVSGIVIVSGDGLVYEVVNSLLNRPDAEAAVRSIPIGVVPAGSGNAVVSSLLNYLGEFHPDNLIQHAALSLVKHRPDSLINLDVGVIQTPTNTDRPLHCVLSVTWGLIADVDAESERFRILGGARFGLLLTKKCLAGIKRYRGRLSYLPADPANQLIDSLPNFDQPVPTSWTVLERDFYTIGALLMSHLAEDFFPVTDWQPDDGLWRLFCVYPCSRSQFLRGFTGAAKGRLEGDSIEVIRARAFRLEPLTPGGHMMIDGEPMSYGPVQGWVMPGKVRVLMSGKCQDMPAGDK